LAKLAVDLKTHEAFFQNLRLTGGRADVFVGLYNRGNTELPLPSELMGALAALGLELLIDMYTSASPNDEA